MARILVADDSIPVRRFIARHLQASGHEVIEAADGVAAYDIGSREPLDMAIMDQLMPGMLGLDVLSRWSEDGRVFPVLILSAVDDEEMVVRCLGLGAVDFVPKPFNMPELIARVNRRLAGV